MVIINGLVYGPSGFFEQRTIRIVNGRFADPALASPNEETVNAEGLFLIPGLTDIHLHGAAGRDFCEGTQEAIEKIAEFEEMNGVTQICPATMTLPEEKLLLIARAAAEFRSRQEAQLHVAESGSQTTDGRGDVHKNGFRATDGREGAPGKSEELISEFQAVFQRQTDPGFILHEKEKSAGKSGNSQVQESDPTDRSGNPQMQESDSTGRAGHAVQVKGAMLVGMHMEGPFLSEAKRGAQSAAYIRNPDPELFERIQNAADNLVKIVDIAPEKEGAPEFIRRERDRVICSFAHSDADYAQAAAGFDAGITQMTHLYNGMRPIHHRDPGPILAGADAGVRAELICDGVHVHPAAVRAAFDLFGEDHILFISDSVASTGISGNTCLLGGEQVVIQEGKALRPDGTLAGGNRTLMQNLVNAVKTMDIPLETAVKCAAVNPANAIGIYEEYGSIEDGKAASLAGLDAGLRLCMVFNRGRRVI